VAIVLGLHSSRTLTHISVLLCTCILVEYDRVARNTIRSHKYDFLGHCGFTDMNLPNDSVERRMKFHLHTCQTVPSQKIETEALGVTFVSAYAFSYSM
jgi:hypothetical protein